MKKIIIIFLIIVIFVVACKQETPAPVEVECNTANDCATGGCSGQICGKKGEVEMIITTCEFRAEYECLKQTSCSCINNKCQSEQNDAYLECLAKING